MHNQEANVVGLTIQWGGLAIITILSFLMAQSARRRFVEYWTLGWACLMLARTGLLIAFSLPVPPRALYFVFFLADYANAYLFLAGCRNHAHGTVLRRKDAWVLAPALLVALSLPLLSDHFYPLLVPHGAILAVFWILAYRTLRPDHKERPSAGMRVMLVALVMLTVNAIQYVVAFGYGVWTDHPLPFPYLTYWALYELLLEILLAFGTVILLMESVCRQLEGKNHELKKASAHLQALAEQDPLTEALNRYAFYSFLQKNGGGPGNSVDGCVALVDVDDFKTINDTLGHTAGDAAIRAVARAIRSVIRADDLLFRWGGDEFLVLLVGLPESEGRARMELLNSTLRNTGLTDADDAVDLAVSFGVAAFAEPAVLEATIEQADREMYNHKQTRKSGLLPRPLASALSAPVPAPLNAAIAE